MPDLKTKVLYYGDNLEILREYIPDESVDLIYLDPPFNSQQQYNVLFKEPTGQSSTAQIRAFTDTWHWDMAAERAYDEIITNAPLKASKAIEALRTFIGANDVMAYLVMRTLRLVELHRVLKPTGSLYLHCDPTASHYLKVILDTIFGPTRFRNEITWKRTSAHSSSKRFGPVHDALLFYTKTDDFTWNRVYIPYDKEYVEKFYRHIDENGSRYRLDNLTASGVRHGISGQAWHGVDPTEKGRHWVAVHSTLDEWDAQGRIHRPERGKVPAYKRYLNEMQGLLLQDVIVDIAPVATHAKERLGYATQKPLPLLEGIIAASSNEGDVVLDPFCGCGTAVIAAQQLDRRWIGIDITHLAITVMRKRLEDSFPGVDYEVVGEPRDLEGARALARQDRYQFQWWALSLVSALPQGGERKKGADEGIDGVISFGDDRSGKAMRVLVQVKSGHVGVRDIREMKAVVGDENLGLFITLQPSTEPMRVEAATAGFHSSPLWDRDFPRIQICPVEELLHGNEPDLPRVSGRVRGFARAPRLASVAGQMELSEPGDDQTGDLEIDDDRG